MWLDFLLSCIFTKFLIGVHLYQVPAVVLWLEVQHDHAGTYNINRLLTSKLGGQLTRKVPTFLKVKIFRTLETCLHDAVKINLSDVSVH